MIPYDELAERIEKNQSSPVDSRVKALGQFVQMYRIGSNMARADLANEIGVSSNFILFLEHGLFELSEMTDETIKQFEQYFGVNYEQILESEDTDTM